MNYEAQIERALVGSLTSAGLPAFAPRGCTVLPDTHIAVTCDIEAADGLALTDNRNPNSFEFCRQQGAVTFAVSTKRPRVIPASPIEYFAGVRERHEAFLGRIRAAMLYRSRPFTGQNLPWYAVSHIRQTGLAREVEGQAGIDVSTLTYEIEFAIRDEAWPAAS